MTADFLRKWAEKVCGERFPQAFGPTDAMDRSDRRHTYIYSARAARGTVPGRLCGCTLIAGGGVRAEASALDVVRVASDASEPALFLHVGRIDRSLRFRFNDFEQRSTFALKEITARRDSTHEKDLHSMDDRRRIRRL